MSFSLLAAVLLGGSQKGATTSLNRAFALHEKLAYQVRSHITSEVRIRHLETWIPSDLDINYNFSTLATQLRPDGIAVLRYERPTLTEIEGETFTSPPKTHVRKLGWVYDLTVSPINEVLEQKVISKNKDESSDEDEMRSPTPGAAVQGGAFEQFVSEVHRLALFIGGLDSALDFAPRLPLDAVKVNDTWKRTVGYQPQKLKGTDGKIAVQRLDYTYTYLGPVKEDGTTYLRVEGVLDFSTDLAEFFKQMKLKQGEEFFITKIPLHLKAVIDFNLDPKTKETVSAAAKSEGGYQVFSKASADDAEEEERFKGRTDLERIGKKFLMPAKKRH